jgi:multicomponent K+:H+ antiporter subunit A
MTFLWFSAPDLALTQLAVEVVTTVLILLGLRWLPRRCPSRTRGRQRACGCACAACATAAGDRGRPAWRCWPTP